MNDTKIYNYDGIAEYCYKIVTFGSTEMILIAFSYYGTYCKAYNLSTYSLGRAMYEYHNELETLKNQTNDKRKSTNQK